MKKALRCAMFGVPEETASYEAISAEASAALPAPAAAAKRIVVPLLDRLGLSLVRKRRLGALAYQEGRISPASVHTHLGFKRLDNIRFCVEEALKEGVPGDLIETGVWRGGSTIFMRAVLKAYAITDRKVWVADSFEGLPRPDSCV